MSRHTSVVVVFAIFRSSEARLRAIGDDPQVPLRACYAVKTCRTRCSDLAGKEKPRCDFFSRGSTRSVKCGEVWRCEVDKQTEGLEGLEEVVQETSSASDTFEG